jgi:hypothetical protein
MLGREKCGCTACKTTFEPGGVDRGACALGRHGGAGEQVEEERRTVNV